MLVPSSFSFGKVKGQCHTGRLNFIFFPRIEAALFRFTDAVRCCVSRPRALLLLASHHSVHVAGATAYDARPLICCSISNGIVSAPETYQLTK